MTYRVKLSLYLLVAFCIGAVCGIIAFKYATDYANTVSADGYRMKARELFNSGDFDGALEKLFYAIDRNPSLYSSYALVGDIYRLKGNFQRSGEFYEAAIRASHLSSTTIMGLTDENLIKHDRQQIQNKLQNLRESKGQK
jgi:tetratricopeptide (TPR) repeat protein